MRIELGKSQPPYSPQQGDCLSQWFERNLRPTEECLNDPYLLWDGWHHNANEPNYSDGRRLNRPPIPETVKFSAWRLRPEIIEWADENGFVITCLSEKTLTYRRVYPILVTETWHYYLEFGSDEAAVEFKLRWM